MSEASNTPSILYLWFTLNVLRCLVRGHDPYRPKFSTVWCRRCGRKL